MAASATPSFTSSNLLGQVQVTTANSNRDGTTGTYSAAVNAGTNGSLVDYIVFQAIVTSTAGLIRIFISDGTAYREIAEVVTKAATVSGTVGGDQEVWTPPGGVPLKLPVGYSVKFNIANTETWNCFVHGENY